MKRSIETLAAAAATLVLVAASLLIPGKLMAKEDQRNNGIVQASDKVYYTGALDTYLGDKSFYNRLMLMTGRWESKEQVLYADLFEGDWDEYLERRLLTSGGEAIDRAMIDAYEASDYISRLALLYMEEDGTENQINNFFYQGNSIRALCNLTAFEMMPNIFSPYYQSWNVDATDVYRYTDSYFGKYKCDMAWIRFRSQDDIGKYGSLLVDVESGDYIGFMLVYPYVKWDMEYDYVSYLRDVVRELESYQEEGVDVEDIKYLEEAGWLKDWLALFIDGEAASLEDGSTGKNPLPESREEKGRLNENLASFMNLIDFERVEAVTDPAEIEAIPRIPMFNKIFYYVDENGDLLFAPEPLTYAWSVTERGTQKKFYFVISSREGLFQAYFSPMPEKSTENSLTDR